jgi:RNA polymerase sigma factor for flagellar operon FliA
MLRAHARYAAESSTEDALVARHAPLLERAARRLAARTGGAVTPEDLWSAGAMGLLEAARRFDPARDVRFESFAERRIRGAMLDEMRRMDHLPRRLRAQVERVERVRASATQRLGREATADDVAAEIGLPLEEVDALLSLGRPQADGLEFLPAEQVGADEQVARAETARLLAAAVARLPERLQILLSLHYDEGLTYREIARVLEVSEPRVCQLHAEAARMLREAMGAE